MSKAAHCCFTKEIDSTHNIGTTTTLPQSTITLKWQHQSQSWSFQFKYRGLVFIKHLYPQPQSKFFLILCSHYKINNLTWLLLTRSKIWNTVKGAKWYFLAPWFTWWRKNSIKQYRIGSSQFAAPSKIDSFDVLFLVRLA